MVGLDQLNRALENGIWCSAQVGFVALLCPPIYIYIHVFISMCRCIYIHIRIYIKNPLFIFCDSDENCLPEDRFLEMQSLITGPGKNHSKSGGRPRSRPIGDGDLAVRIPIRLPFPK